MSASPDLPATPGTATEQPDTPATVPSIPSAATATATPAATSAPVTPTPAQSTIPIAKPAPKPKPMPVSSRMQRLKTHSDHLSENCTRTIHASLHRAEHNIALTANVFQQTLTIVQDNTTNLKVAAGNLTEAQPYLEALCANKTFPPIKSL